VNDIPDDMTQDIILGDRLVLVQPRGGYRFSVDSLLLADFAAVKPGRRVVDLGAGVGVVSLALALKMGQGRVIAVEMQTRLADMARTNVRNNKVGADVEVMEIDWTELTASDVGGPVDHVVSNPPYRRLGSGRINPEDEKAMARHEISGNMDTCSAAAGRILGKGGIFSIIYPAVRLAGLFASLRSAGFEPKRLRNIHSREGEEARLVLVEARPGGGEGMVIEPPLYMYKGNEGRDYTPETAAIIQGTGSDV
jgi:tRNA1Val (adenine37-N6)-methyltransferase